MAKKKAKSTRRKRTPARAAGTPVQPVVPEEQMDDAPRLGGGIEATEAQVLAPRVEPPPSEDPGPLPSPVEHLYQVKRACTFRGRHWDPDHTYDRKLGPGLIRMEICSEADVPPFHFHPLDGGPVLPMPENSASAVRFEQIWERRNRAMRGQQGPPKTYAEYHQQYQQARPLGAPE